MNREQYYGLLVEKFPKVFSKYHLKHSNELYLELSSEMIPEVCQFIYSNLTGPLVDLFASDERTLTQGNFAVYYVFSLKKDALFLIVKTLINEKSPIFPSITTAIPAANLYEREIRDLFGLTPQGHPDLRPLIFHGNWPAGVYPLRKEFTDRTRPPVQQEKTELFDVQGTGVFEIPVGPVHAGIIEPGHFRFSVAGEPIINLEAQLYYVHKGIEKLCEGQSIEKCFYIAERISGDETFSNSLAYCQAIEKIAAVEIPERSAYSRVVFAELERLVSHLGDLGGICVDMGFGFAASQFKMLRIWTYQAIEEVSGSRFFRSVNRPGGLRKDFLIGKDKKIRDYLIKIENELNDTISIIKSNSLLIDRVEHTGILQTKIAIDMNAVGPAGRASGIKNDLRKDIPYAAYGKLHFEVPDHRNGDVNCRMNVKIEECFTAIDLINQAVEDMPSGNILTQIAGVEPYRYALGYSESPRGENIHWLMTGPGNTIFRYKIRTPSFCNWPALCHAVKGNIVPDFPLINKSFNLSYAGNDL